MAPKTRKVAAVCGDGHIRVVERPVSEVKPGTVLIKVHSSLVSPGTELRGWKGFAAVRGNPGDAKQERPFGYSNSGVVMEVGEGVEELQKGDRVAAIGGGYAQHTDYAVVPHNLCVPLPEELTFDQGAYAMLAATGLQAMRRANPSFGETVAVAGLGIVGQCTAQLYQLAGCYAIGWDSIGRRIEIAESWGINRTVNVTAEDTAAVTKAFTGGYGLDHAVVAFGGNADAAMASILESMKVSPDGHPMGVVVVVGGASFQHDQWLTNMDVRRSSRTGAGYHDEAWEVGPSYPPVFMRWTTQTNLALCMRLIAEGRLNVDALTTHTVSLDGIDEETSAMLNSPDEILGVLIHMQ